MLQVSFRPNGRKRVQTVFTKPSLTVQADKDKTSIHKILDKYKKAGVAKGTLQPPKFGDFSGVPDFQTANNFVIANQEQFQKLPSRIRDRFKNDISTMIKFVDDPANKDECIKLGLLPKPVIKYLKEFTPSGDFWITIQDGVEVKREPVKPSAE